MEHTIEKISLLFFLLGLFVLVFAILGYMLFDVVYITPSLNKYCKEKGFDGTEIAPFVERRCWKAVSHPSGVGEEFVYSGAINMDMAWED